MQGRHPDCPDVHLGSCPKCERLWKRDAARQGSVHEQSAVGAVDAGSPGQSADPSSVPLEVSGSGAPSKALTPAEKQRRYRQRHGDRVRKLNRERMRRSRNK